MVSIGLGSKPFLDVKPSNAAINGRAVNHVINGTGKVATALSSPCSANWDPGPGAPGVALSRPRSLLSLQRALTGPCIEAALLEQRPNQLAFCPFQSQEPKCAELCPPVTIAPPSRDRTPLSPTAAPPPPAASPLPPCTCPLAKPTAPGRTMSTPALRRMNWSRRRGARLHCVSALEPLAACAAASGS